MSIKRKNFITFLSFLALFLLFTILVKVVDVKSIGPEESSVGFASINESVHNFLNYNDTFYKISKVLGYLSFLFIGMYGLIGLKELIKKKNIFKVNSNLLFLGAFYVLVLFVYALFEMVIINFRPVLEEGVLEASYPSSHTILSICVCMSSIFISKKLFNKNISKWLNAFSYVLMFAIIVTRVLSGVHWLTDIIGGILISVSLCSLFKSFIEKS